MKPLAFEGVTGRASYLLASLAVLLGQHLTVYAALSAGRGSMVLPSWFWINPSRALMFEVAGQGANAPASWVLILGMVATVVADALLVSLAFARVRRAVGPAWITMLTIVPVLQILVIAWLSLAPDRREAVDPQVVAADRIAARTVALGLLVGVGLVVFAVAFSTLVLGVYGYVLFLVSPVLIAMVIGYIVNREGRVGLGKTMSLVFLAFALSGLALLGFAFEGVICLLMAAPLIAAAGLIGAMLGRGLALLGPRRRGTTLSSIAVLPLLLAGEALAPPHAEFESVESVVVAAPPAAVWDSVVHMGPIPGAPAAPFRWGLAYPLRGEIQGQGVGAIRRGVFSTGVAYERVTAWEPGRKLDFVVLSDPPSLKELSPYDHVNAPHMNGYFRTQDARFTITPLADGRTRLTLATHHALDLEPALYWTPMAQWAVHANKQRVLAHFRQQAEASVSGS